MGLSWVGESRFDSSVGGCARPGETHGMKATMKVAEMKPFKVALEAMRARLRGDVTCHPNG